MIPDQPDSRGLPPRDRATTEAALRCLHASPYLALKTIHCECRDGILTLTGQLPSYYLKQRAQALFTTLEGVQRIDNRIEVAAPASLAGPPQGDGQAGEAHPHLGVLPRSVSSGG